MAALRKKWSARDPKTFTHLLLDGGKLHVPDQQHTPMVYPNRAMYRYRGELLPAEEIRRRNPAVDMMFLSQWTPTPRPPRSSTPSP